MIGVDSGVNVRPAGRGGVSPRVRRLLGLPAGLFWRVPLQDKVLFPVLLLAALATAALGFQKLSLTEVLLLEVGLLFFLSRVWLRLVLDRRISRLSAAAAHVAEGRRDVVVKETGQGGRGDAISHLGRNLGRMVVQVQEQAARRAALDSLTQEAARGLGLGHLYTRAAGLVAEGTGAELAAVYEAFAPSGMLLLRAAAGGARRPREQLALLGGRQYLSQVLHADEARVGDAAAAAKLGLAPTTRSLAAIKIPGRQAPYGMLLVASSQQDAFPAHKLEFLTSVSNMVAAAVTALHDPLTELPNRALCEDRLSQALNEAQRVGEGVCLYYIDLDNFKEVNDSLGHQAGDALLRLVADRLRKVLRTSDLLARLGGDEFALVQTLSPARGQGQGAPALRPHEVAAQTASRLLEALAKPFVVDTAQLFVSASVGIAVYPEHGTTPNLLSRNADRAMYDAKVEQKGAFRIFTDSMHSTTMRRLTIESGLRAALHDDRLELHFQPQVDVASPGRIVGFEALLRWPGSGTPAVTPATFVPIAEQTGLIVPLGLWALRRACQQAARWQRQGLPPVRMAVNVAAAQFARQDFVDSVRLVLEETGLDPALLELEVTEGSVMRDLDTVTQRLHELRELGVTIAVDDFGTGYSSLAYLNRLPFDALKVDRSFVSSLQREQGGGDPVLVNAIVQLGRNLNKVVIAEGIETAEQLRHLQGLGCDLGQGFLFARAITADDAGHLLRQAPQAGKYDDRKERILAPAAAAAGPSSWPAPGTGTRTSASPAARRA